MSNCLFRAFRRELGFSAYFAFLLPCYSTFKALSHRPVSEPDLERLSMYWAVIGAFVAFQYTAEWLISWYVHFDWLNDASLMVSKVPLLFRSQDYSLAFLVSTTNSSRSSPTLFEEQII